MASSVQRPVILVGLEGNIGAGKTSLLDYARLIPNVAVLYENEIAWRNQNGQDLLAHYYRSPQQHAATFQFVIQRYQALDMRVAVQEAQRNHSVLVTERTPAAGEIFIKEARARGQLDKVAYDSLIEGTDMLNREFRYQHIIYLFTSYEQAYERTNKRRQDREKEGRYEPLVPKSHVKNLHERYEKWIQTKEKDPDVTVHVIHGNSNLVDVEKELAQILHNIMIHEDSLYAETK